MTLPSSRNSERVAKILHAAAQIFALQGYHGTSTREIAHIAGVSENTLFRYFEHKEDLFWAVLHSRLSGLELRKDLLEGITIGADPEVVLPLLFAQLVDTIIVKPELLRLLAIAFVELRHKAEIVCFEHLTPVLSAVNRYLVVNVEKGKLRPLDTSLATAALAASVMVYPELSKFILGTPPPYLDRREAIRTYSRFWMDVLAPAPADRAQAMFDLVQTTSTVDR